MLANGERERERERDWCRHIKVNIASADRLVERERERERERCVFFLNFVRLLLFFLLWELSTYFKVLCRSLQKNLIVRDVLRFQFLSTILTGIPSCLNERKRFGFLKKEQNSVVIHR